MHAAATVSASAFPDTIGADGTIDEATVNKAVALLQSGMNMHHIDVIAFFFQQLYQSFSCMRLLGSWLVLFSCVRPFLRQRFYGTILLKVASYTVLFPCLQRTVSLCLCGSRVTPRRVQFDCHMTGGL